MQSGPSSFISAGNIIADATPVVGDQEFKKKTKPYYIGLVQRAVQKLALDSFYDRQTTTLKVNGCQRIALPKGAFNLGLVWGFNGDKCDPATAVLIHPKTVFYGTKGNTFFARDNGENAQNPLQNRRRSTFSSGIYFYSVAEGYINLSPSSRKFENLFVEYNGIGGDIEADPCIPYEFREAITAWVANKAAQSLKADAIGTNEFGQYHVIQNDTYLELYGRNGRSGVWNAAETFAKSMNRGERLMALRAWGRINS